MEKGSKMLAVAPYEGFSINSVLTILLSRLASVLLKYICEIAAEMQHLLRRAVSGTVKTCSSGAVQGEHWLLKLEYTE